LTDEELETIAVSYVQRHTDAVTGRRNRKEAKGERRDGPKTQHGIETIAPHFRQKKYNSRDGPKTQHGIETTERA
jgi:hypothetical protein